MFELNTSKGYVELGPTVDVWDAFSEMAYKSRDDLGQRSYGNLFYVLKTDDTDQVPDWYVEKVGEQARAFREAYSTQLSDNAVAVLDALSRLPLPAPGR
jgi:hypothetical protein